jgi:hypothetical protein
VVVSDKKIEEKPKKIEPETKPIEVKPEAKPIESKPEKLEKPTKSGNVAREHIYYTLKDNENIDSICRKFNLSISQLKSLNKNFDIIHAKSGDEIRVK